MHREVWRGHNQEKSDERAVIPEGTEKETSRNLSFDESDITYGIAEWWQVGRMDQELKRIGETFREPHLTFDDKSHLLECCDARIQILTRDKMIQLTIRSRAESWGHSSLRFSEGRRSWETSVVSKRGGKVISYLSNGILHHHKTSYIWLVNWRELWRLTAC